jgi:hypothetical protein
MEPSRELLACKSTRLPVRRLAGCGTPLPVLDWLTWSSTWLAPASPHLSRTLPAGRRAFWSARPAGVHSRLKLPAAKARHGFS